MPKFLSTRQMMKLGMSSARNVSRDFGADVGSEVRANFMTQEKELNVETQAQCGFVDAVFQGLADDGGLFFPTSYSNLAALFESFESDISFVDLASKMTHALFPSEYNPEEARALCASAFNFEPKLRELDEQITLLELFHGPSCAFKDFGASYLAAVMEQGIQRSGQKLTILTATSGDTGSAVAQAFYGKAGIQVVILYPSGRVSPLQEKQLTTLGGNVHALEVEGSFDDCQGMVKDAFLDVEKRAEFGLSSANSINIGRLIPQSFYYVYAWNLLRQRDGQKSSNSDGQKNRGTNGQSTENSSADDWLFCTPSGNFGNLTAGLLAKRWGLPLTRVIAACNANDVVPHYLHSGRYTPRASISTLANAMDVGAPSNFERMHLMYALEAAKQTDTHTELSALSDIEESAIHHAMSNELYYGTVDDVAIREEIMHTYRTYGQYICPHTAVGTRVAKKVLAQQNTYSKAIVLSTAHAGKFFEVIEESCGTRPQLPERLEIFLHKKSFARKTKPTLSDLFTALKELR